MTRAAVAIILLLGFVLSCASGGPPADKPGGPATQPATQPALIPQAVPYDAFWRALKTEDLELFMSAFSERKKKDFAEDWQKTFEGYLNLDLLARALGGTAESDWLKKLDVSAFRYEYEGDDKSGTAFLIAPGSEGRHGMRVVLEADGWKLDEN